MADTFLLEIVTPYRRLLSTEVSEVTAPGAEGEFGVLAGHAAYLTLIKPGEISYKKGADSGLFAVGSGYAEVLPDKTTILVESAETASEIDVEKAKATLAASEESLKKLSPADAEYSATVNAYELSQARIRVKERQR